MKTIHVHGKCFDPRDFEGLVIGGQNDADTIRFVIPKVFGGELDYSQWQWAIHYENKEGQGDTVGLKAQISKENDANLWIDWTPTQTATQVSGKLLCQLYAIKVEGDNTRRFSFHSFPLYVDEWLNPELITQTDPTLIEQALEEMAKYNQDLQKGIQAAKDAAASEANAAASANEAASSASAAKTSETNAANSESSADSSASTAMAKASEAAASATAANSSKAEAASSASAAKISERNAKTSETNSKTSESAAKASQDAAAESEVNAKNSETAAKNSQNAAKTSEENAKVSESNANTYKNNADASAKKSERFAKGTENGVPVASGEGYQDNSKYYKDQAEASKNSAETSANTATAKATEAATSASSANTSKTAAETAKNQAQTYAENAQSSATVASEAANTATAKASEASSSASNALTYKNQTEVAKTAAKAAQERCEQLVESVDAKGLGERMNAIEANMANKLDKTANAASASKWQTARKLALSGDVSGEVTLDGSADKTMTVTHKNSGATAGAYGPTAAATLAFGGSVNVPQITIDAKGHVTKGTHFAIKLPAAPTSVSGNAGTATKLQTKRTIKLSGDASGSAQFDGSTDVTISVTNKRRLPAGTIIWFAGKKAQKPEGTLVCDGSAISRTTYADLFAAIGTIYGAGNGSTTFNIPDLMDAGDSANLGRFIRAATSDADVGKKEADAIRNIIGNIHWWKVLTRKSEGIYGEGGALRYVKGSGKYTPGNENNSESTGFDFDASRVVPTDSENRPYDIALLPLISY